MFGAVLLLVFGFVPAVGEDGVVLDGGVLFTRASLLVPELTPGVFPGMGFSTLVFSPVGALLVGGTISFTAVAVPVLGVEGFVAF